MVSNYTHLKFKCFQKIWFFFWQFQLHRYSGKRTRRWSPFSPKQQWTRFIFSIQTKIQDGQIISSNTFQRNPCQRTMAVLVVQWTFFQLMLKNLKDFFPRELRSFFGESCRIFRKLQKAKSQDFLFASYQSLFLLETLKKVVEDNLWCQFCFLSVLVVIYYFNDVFPVYSDHYFISFIHILFYVFLIYIYFK